MPMSEDFKGRLFPVLPQIIEEFGTPFIIYDEKGIREGHEKLMQSFKDVPYRNFFAVKATPNPKIMGLLKVLGQGFDCSSIPELLMARQVGAKPEDIMFTSNNTSKEEFEVALSDGGCILNLDDISMIEKVPQMPELICFRYNPGNRRSGNSIIGNPTEAKYGVPHEDIVEAYRVAIKKGASRFGLHTMICSNQLDYKYIVETLLMLEEIAVLLYQELDIKLEFINIGGGFGIPYKICDNHFDLEKMGEEVSPIIQRLNGVYGDGSVKLFTELGRWVTGPHGVLVMKVINKMSKHRKYVGVNTSMSANMRPAIYGAYHRISVLGKDGSEGVEVVDVVGSLCENNDKFAVDRMLPIIQEGDILIQHDVGAHGPAMGFNYNGRLRPKELQLRPGGHVVCIRREETVEDYLKTLTGGEVGRVFIPKL